MQLRSNISLTIDFAEDHNLSLVFLRPVMVTNITTQNSNGQMDENQPG